MPQAVKSKDTEHRKRQAKHIEKSYAEHSVPADGAQRRAWATVNKLSGAIKRADRNRVSLLCS